MTAPTPLVFDAQQPLPGGPWRTYRPKTTVSAIRLQAAFTVVDSTGQTVTVTDGWLVITTDGQLTGMTAEDFASQYEPAP